MSNRRKIEKALRALGAEGALVEFIRNRDMAYGDSWDASYWSVDFTLNDQKHHYESDLGDTVDEGVEIMLEEMQSDFAVNN